MSEFKELRDYDSNGRLEYYGQAEAGAGEGDAKWMIRRYTYSGSVETGKTYPNGSTENMFIWRNRKTYRYR